MSVRLPGSKLKDDVAVIIGCAPAFAGVIRRRFGTPYVSYDSRGYVKRNNKDIELKGLGDKKASRSERKDTKLWNIEEGSQEALADPGGLITVTTTKFPDNEPSTRPSTMSSAHLPE